MPSSKIKLSPTPRAGADLQNARGAIRSVTAFRHWRERLVVTKGAQPDLLRYTRKSTESDDRQATSHLQQAGAMDNKWGEIDATWCWSDSCSGTTFDRPAFQDLLDFCRSNSRSKKTPGRVEMYDPSRFGRTLDEDGTPDIMSFIAVLNEFTRCGWRVEFVTVDRTGDDLVDMITMALYAYAAALYSKNLSESVVRGRVKHAADGWWVGGSAPWGTKRFDTQASRVLEDGERSTPGGGGTILQPDRAVLKLWKPAARRIMAGASLDAVGAHLFDKGVRGPRGGKVGHAALRNFLLNPALIGVVEYHEAKDKNGARAERRVKAKWDPMVDEELFEQLAKRLHGHSRASGPRRRRRRELFPLTPACAHCGVEYNGGRLAAAQGSARGYVHAQPKERMDADAFRRQHEHGCKAWYVDAEELEVKIKDLIVAERTSDDFVAEVRVLVEERDTFRVAANDAVHAAEEDLARAKHEYATLARTLAAVAKATARAGDAWSDEAAGEAVDPLAEQLIAAKQRLRTAEGELAEARAFAASKERAWERLQSIIYESRTLAAAWEKSGPEERRILLEYWVLDVLIVVEPIPGMRRANRKTALVRLRSAPNAPRHFDLGTDQRPPDKTPNADTSSRRTPSSASTSKRPRTASSAVAEPNRPSAHAACTLTSGSSSDRAVTSRGTSSGEPTLPSTTAALRFNPRSFARFIGEPLNAAVNSARDMATSSRDIVGASRPATAARGANGESVESPDANLWLYGHTS